MCACDIDVVNINTLLYTTTINIARINMHKSSVKQRRFGVFDFQFSHPLKSIIEGYKLLEIGFARVNQN